MKLWNATGACVLGLLAAAPSLAQWPALPDRNAPRTPDGTIDLEGPVPRTAEGRPDFTGVWENAWFHGGRIGQPPVSPPGAPPASAFADIFSNFEPEDIPIRPWAAELKAQRTEQHSKDNPDAHCLPMGLLQFHIHPQPRKIVQTPELLVILYEGNAGIRQIFIDGRPIPDNDPQPWWYGYSIGHWAGDELVVETSHFREDGWLDINGSPRTDEATITERWRRLSYGTLQIDVTIDDPKAYTRPFSVRFTQYLMQDTEQTDAELIEFICQENNRAPDLMVGK